MRPTASISAGEARRIALAAQGFTDPRPGGRVDRRHLRRVLRRTLVIQLDSVNVLARAHYLPPYSRLGPYPRELLDRAAYEHGELFEYWGHEASLQPRDLHPLLRWRMERIWSGAEGTSLRQMELERPGYVAAVLAEVAERGPIAAGELSEPGGRSDPWWGWGDGKRALEWLFWTGRLAAVRRPSFERVYDLPERVLPPEVLAAPTPEPREAKRELLRMAAGATGVATAADLVDYFRLPKREGPRLVGELAEEGDLLPVEVEGWNRPAFLHPGAVLPRRVEARTLLSPFDPVVWARSRAERLFGFRYRIEIYTPAPRRVYGYYVLPFLLGDRLVARVDLKADRRGGALLVPAAHAEPGLDPKAIAPPLAEELRGMAGWLGLERVEAADRGDLAGPLRRALRSYRDAAG